MTDNVPPDILNGDLSVGRSSDKGEGVLPPCEALFLLKTPASSASATRMTYPAPEVSEPSAEIIIYDIKQWHLMLLYLFAYKTELQLRRGIEDKSKDNFSYFSTKTYVVTPHYNRLDETVLTMGDKICFHGGMWLIIPKLSLLPLLIWSTAIRCYFSSSKMNTNILISHKKFCNEIGLSLLNLGTVLDEKKTSYNRRNTVSQVVDVQSLPTF